MPILVPRTHIVELSEPRKFLVRDDFTDNVAAGSVNGTSPTPGPGVRSVVDTGNDLSVSGGTLISAGAAGSGDPMVSYDPQVATTGLALFAKVSIPSTSGRFYIGFDNTADTHPLNRAFLFSTVSRVFIQEGPISVQLSYTTSYEHMAIVVRAAGAFYLARLSEQWTLLYVTHSDVTTPLYPGWSDFTYDTAAKTVSYLRVAQLGSPWSDTYAMALAYATFTDSNDTAIADYTPEVGGALAGGTWTIQSNKASNTPVAGAEAVDNPEFTDWTGDNPDWWVLLGTEDANNYVTEAPAGHMRLVSDGTAIGVYKDALLATGTWYLVSINISARTSGGVIVQLGTHQGIYSSTGIKTHTNRATGTILYLLRFGATDITVDSVSVKPLTLSELISGRDYGYSDTLVDGDLTVTANIPCGVVACLDSLATPANFIIGWHEGTNAHLEKCVAGVYTSLIDTAAAYAAGATMRIIKDGTEVTLFYNSVKIGASQTVNDAGIISNTIHGVFSTSASSPVDNFAVWPRDIIGSARAELEKYTR